VPNAQNRTMRYWSDCACADERDRRWAAMRERSAQRMADIDSALLGDAGHKRIEHLTLDCFDPYLLDGDGAEHPYTVATTWLDTIRDRAGVIRYGQGPPACLYFYSAGKGRGKTHLAAALFHQARLFGCRVAFVEELSYLSRYWNMPLCAERELMITLPGERAWLTVIDDLGRRPPGRDRSSTQNAWNDMISRRYNRRGWSIITSNLTLDELVEQGTIDDAAYSRLYEMTQGACLSFVGVDQRLAVQTEAAL
jgi:hypothetical protein